MKRYVIWMLFLVGCQPTVPKPKAQLALEYPKPKYSLFDTICSYQFFHNDIATTQALSSCGTTIDYNTLKAKLYITYFDLTKASLDTLLLDFEKRLNMFGKQTSQIQESSFEDKENNVIGACVVLVGNSPSNLHFFGTDNQKHYLTGSLLFETTPNYDSLVPAILYIKNDVQKLLETLRWKN